MPLDAPPLAIFKDAFDEYNFSIIFHLFDDNKPCTLSTQMENVQTKCIIFGETLRFRGKNIQQNLPKNCAKSTKMTITVCKFSKIFFRGSLTPDPQEPFSFSICFKIILPGKITHEKYVKNWCPLPKKIYEYTSDMQTFFKGWVQRLCVVNIQPNSKFHPPTKIFWICS